MARPLTALSALVDRLRWLSSSIGFKARLFTALGLALVLVGAFAYALIDRQLEHNQFESLIEVQQADVEGFEMIADQNRQTAVREIDEILDAVGRRPGVVETSLIDLNGVIVASSVEPLTGKRDDSAQIRDALELGVARYGKEADEGEDSSNFEFVTPLRILGRQYALETSYDRDQLDAQLADMRRALGLVGVLALIAVAVFFYVFGGRTLLRNHRIALRRATLDGLTDLANQRAFQSDFEQAVALAGRSDGALALALLDVDHFKLVNDRHGHPEGDALLRRVGGILRDGRSTDRAYRLGGDEFALLLPATDAEGAQRIVSRLSRRLKDIDTQVSIGAAALRRGETGSELRAEADAALYEAKRRGGNQAVHFDSIEGEVAITTPDRRDALVRLIEEERLTTVFQPIWDFGAGRLLGVEALSRPDPSHGFSGPSEAFDVAAHIGLVPQLDLVCMRHSLKAAAEHEIPAGALLFVNVAPNTLERDAGHSDWLRAAVAGQGLARDQIVIEVTERIGSRVAPVVKSLERLREDGFRLALDDVGTGNSGLEMLRKVDAEYVKIDRSIVVAAATEPNARAVLMAMATFASQTGAFVIAEGIEDDETVDFLRAVEDLKLRPDRIIMGGQGFKLGRPSEEIPERPPNVLGLWSPVGAPDA